MHVVNLHKPPRERESTMDCTKLLLFATCIVFSHLVFLPSVVKGAKVICNTNPNRWCFGQSVPCPLRCSARCSVNCRSCSSSCNVSRCNRPGAVCQDPRFIGGDGTMFYFHGKKDKDFCIVSDPDIHINAHFIGKPKIGPGIKRDFTWVQALGILFGKHKLYVGAKKVGKWDDAEDQLELNLDGHAITLPLGEGAVWEEPMSGITIQRLSITNDVSIDVSNLFTLKAKVVPVTKEDSRIHNYNITDEDCFAHLDLGLGFHKLSGDVTGVLGQTYAPGYVSRVDKTAAMPIMGGNAEYLTSGLMNPDCKVSKFGSKLANLESAKFAFPAMNCGTDGNGFACRR